MGLHFDNFAKLFKSQIKTADKIRVAFISDKYFMFEDITFPEGSLKSSEIESMAKLTIENLFPAGCVDIVSGFFTNQNNSSATAFVTSKNRILSELPEIENCRYWLPEKFAKVVLKNDSMIKKDQEIEIIDVDLSGNILINSTVVKLYSKNFWTAELHDTETKTINKYLEATDCFCTKATKYAFNIATWSALSFLLVLFVNLTATFKKSATELKIPKIQKIIENNKLRNEMSCFDNDRLACLKHLVTINKVRPESLTFSECHMNGTETTNFTGECNTIDTLNRFVKDLTNDSSILSASIIKANQSSNTVSFNLEVEFL